VWGVKQRGWGAGWADGVPPLLQNDEVGHGVQQRPERLRAGRILMDECGARISDSPLSGDLLYKSLLNLGTLLFTTQELPICTLS